MSELGDERDPETGAFDADEWFRAQFGGEQSPPVPPEAPAPPVHPTQPTQPAPYAAPTQPTQPAPYTAPAQPAPYAAPALPPQGVPFTPPPTLVNPPSVTPPVQPPAAQSDLPPWAQPPAPQPPAPQPPAVQLPPAQPPAQPPVAPVYPPAATPVAPPAVQPPAPFGAPPVVPSAAPPTFEPAPTQLSPIIEPEPTQPAEIITSAASTGAATELFARPDDGGALDALFGSDSFQEYDDALISAVPRSSKRGGDGDAPDGERPPLGRTQKVLLWVAGSLVAVLALVAIFFVGTRIPLLLGPAPGAEPLPSASASPSASATPRPVGPVPPGEYRWDEIWGGECIDPFVDAWQEDVSVVDCATPHGGQLVLRAPFPTAAPAGEASTGGTGDGTTDDGTTESLIDDVPYPGEEALAAQMSLLCSAAGVIDLTAAAGVTDLQVQGAYPVSEEQWDAGERDYFCFVSRSSGEPMTGSLAIPAPAV